MHAHCLQHVPFEGLGSIAAWLKKSGYEVSFTKFYESTSLPQVEDIDLLIILGGPMSVNEEEQYPWLRLEKQFIRNCIDFNIPTLGICLGAQLIVSVSEEAVYPHHRKEIGWFPVKGIPQSDTSVFSFPPSIDVFHWHGETFDLPAGATLLASSEACTNQAFQLGSRVMALQFHLETTPESAEAIVTNCGRELQEAKFIQPATAILDQSPVKYKKINSLLEEILAFLTK